MVLELLCSVLLPCSNHDHLLDIMIDSIPNTFGIEAKCETLLAPESVEEFLLMREKVAEALANNCLLIIGRGSNLLPTADFPGMVLRSRIMGKSVREMPDGRILVTCGSGETVDDVIQWCVDHGYHGMENLSLIPGEVGASAVQNIGAYGAEAKDVIESIEAVEISTGDVITIKAEDCCYGYRQSRFKKEWRNRFFITHVTYALDKEFRPKLDYGNIKQSLAQKGILQPTAQQLRDVIISIREEKLPDYHTEGNAGSFFMNPVVSKEKYEELMATYPHMPHYPVDDEHEKIPAGWMIDQCGWRGKTVGNAGVHERQALVLVNRGGAKGDEITALCEMIKSDVKAKFGVDIHPEVNII